MEEMEVDVKLELICMDDVQSKEVEWLWKPYIPYGKITIIQGDPGEGKTTFVLNLASKLSQGIDLEGNFIGEPLNIIYQTAEDGLADTIKPRLENASADCKRVFVIDDSKKSLNMADKRIEEAIVATGARLVILDPIQAYLGDNTDMNKANEVRNYMKKIAETATKYKCAVILIGHMNKGGNGKATYRGLGSIDFVAASRSTLLVARVPNDEDVRAIAHIKSSLAHEGKVVAFRLSEDSGFNWIGEYDISVNELLNGFSTGDKYTTAREFLKAELSDGGRVSSVDIVNKANKLGVSKRTLESVKKELNVISVKVGTNWFWAKENSIQEFKDATPQGV